MKKIAFLGFGAMGQRMVNSLLSTGYSVTVWNRSLDKCEEAVNKGANLANTPREAAEGADYVFSMVRDDEAARSVWLDRNTGAMHAVKNTAIAIECSTLSVNFIKELQAGFESLSKKLIEAPLAGSRPQAEAKKLIFFAAGSENDVDEVRPILLSMGAVCHYCGDTGAGLTIKLMVNSLFGAQVAMMAELMEFGRAQNINLSNALNIIASTPVCSAIASVSAQAMLDQQFAPAFPIDLVSKDFDLLEKSASKVGTPVTLSTQVKKIFDRGIASGIEQLNITGIIKLYNGV